MEFEGAVLPGEQLEEFLGDVVADDLLDVRRRAERLGNQDFSKETARLLLLGEARMDVVLGYLAETDESAAEPETRQCAFGDEGDADGREQELLGGGPVGHDEHTGGLVLVQCLEEVRQTDVVQVACQCHGFTGAGHLPGGESSSNSSRCPMHLSHIGNKATFPKAEFPGR